MGIGADLIKEKESEIINILTSQNIATSDQVDGSNVVSQSKPHDAAVGSQLGDNTIADQSQLQAVSGSLVQKNFIY